MAHEKAENGLEVQIHYTGKLDDGSVFDSSDGKDPLAFVLGQGMVIPGFEEAVAGMAVGEEKDVTITPEKAYGEERPELVQEVPKDKLGDLKPEVGMVIGMQIPGVPQTFPARITAIAESGDVTVDLNPPLAGKTLHFHLKLEAVNDAPEPKEGCGEGCGCGDGGEKEACGCGGNCECAPEEKEEAPAAETPAEEPKKEE